MPLRGVTRARFTVRAGNAAGLPAGTYTAPVETCEIAADGRLDITIGEPRPACTCAWPRVTGQRGGVALTPDACHGCGGYP